LNVLADEGRVPALKVDGEIVVEDVSADLEQQVGASGSPAHLLLLGLVLKVRSPAAK
jgi:hypothetical protein